MALPVSFLSLTINDNTSVPKQENATSEVAVATITAANMVAQVALHDDLIDAIDALVIGQLAKRTLIAARTLLSGLPASDPLAQKENRWLVRYHGSTNFRKYVVTIPTADLSLLAGGSEYLDITTPATPGKAFADAFAAVVRDPNDVAESVVVDSIQFVSR